MADVIKSSSELKLTWQFSDGDTRTQTVKNPRADLTDEDIQSYRDLIAEKQAVIGDQEGAELSETKPLAAAYVEEKSRFEMDLDA